MWERQLDYGNERMRLLMANEQEPRRQFFVSLYEQVGDQIVINTTRADLT